MTEQSPSIVFRLDARSDRAPFRQLVDQVTDAYERGQLQAGDRLPSVREVVRQVTINPNTVHRAYRELEHLGLTRAYSGQGTFILPGPTQSVEGKINSAQDDVDSLIARARSYGLTDGEIVNMVRATLDHLNLEQST